MPKRKFDAALTADIKTVSSDSFRDHIRMLPINSLKASAENFYSLSELELLAEGIVGLPPYSFWQSKDGTARNSSPAISQGRNRKPKPCSI